MARGIVCPRCNTPSEGIYDIGETIQCGTCKSSFTVDYDDIQRYQLAKQKQRLKQIEIENRTPIQRVGFKTLKIIGGVLFIFFLLFVGFKFALSEKETSAEIKAEIAKDHQKQADVKIVTPEQRQQQSAYNVADKYISQYEIAKGNGDKPRKCALAGLVATAYLNANDEQKYRSWKYTEEQDCK